MLSCSTRIKPRLTDPPGLVPPRRDDDDRQPGVVERVGLSAARSFVGLDLLAHPSRRARFVLTFQPSWARTVVSELAAAADHDVGEDPHAFLDRRRREVAVAEQHRRRGVMCFRGAVVAERINPNAAFSAACSTKAGSSGPVAG